MGQLNAGQETVGYGGATLLNGNTLIPAVDYSRTTIEELKKKLGAEEKKQATLIDLLEIVSSSISSSALMLVLLATLTYVGYLKPPGGFDEDGHLTHQCLTMNLFLYFNLFSSYLAISGLVLCVHFSLCTTTFLRNEKKRCNWVTIRQPRTHYETDAVMDPELLGHLEPELARLASKIRDERQVTEWIAKRVTSALVRLFLVKVMFIMCFISCACAFSAAGLLLIVTDRPVTGFMTLLLIPTFAGVYFCDSLFFSSGDEPGLAIWSQQRQIGNLVPMNPIQIIFLIRRGRTLGPLEWAPDYEYVLFRSDSQENAA